MLPHSRCNCDTFCDYERNWVDCDGDGPRVEGGRRVRVKGCRIDFTVDTRHVGEGGYMCVYTARQRRGGRDDYAGIVVGIRCMSRSESLEKDTHRSKHGCLYVL